MKVVDGSSCAICALCNRQEQPRVRASLRSAAAGLAFEQLRARDESQRVGSTSRKHRSYLSRLVQGRANVCSQPQQPGVCDQPLSPRARPRDTMMAGPSPAVRLVCGVSPTEASIRRGGSRCNTTKRIKRDQGAKFTRVGGDWWERGFQWHAAELMTRCERVVWREKEILADILGCIPMTPHPHARAIEHVDMSKRARKHAHAHGREYAHALIGNGQARTCDTMYICASAHMSRVPRAAQKSPQLPPAGTYMYALRSPLRCR